MVRFLINNHQNIGIRKNVHVSRLSETFQIRNFISQEIFHTPNIN